MTADSLNRKWTLSVHLLFMFAILTTVSSKQRRTNYRYDVKRTTSNKYTKTMCMNMDNTLRARHRSCFLRPDTGPCRADIIQWYFDVKQNKCYRFFWGGCQGNGNNFDTNKECLDYCYMNSSYTESQIPSYCQMTFDYGTCFGQYYRWSWDKLTKTCRRRLYSGCGGNQNNFETQAECMKTCLVGPSSNQKKMKLTTCIPLNMDV